MITFIITTTDRDERVVKYLCVNTSCQNWNPDRDNHIHFKENQLCTQTFNTSLRLPTLPLRIRLRIRTSSLRPSVRPKDHKHQHFDLRYVSGTTKTYSQTISARLRRNTLPLRPISNVYDYQHCHSGLKYAPSTPSSGAQTARTSLGPNTFPVRFISASTQTYTALIGPHTPPPIVDDFRA